MPSSIARFKALIQRIFPTLFSRLAMIVVICLPLVYSALYLWAFWDPYHHLDQLPVAVVNLDRGGVQDGKPKNIGNELVDDLKTDTNLKWVFTTLADAQQGLQQKRYYSYICVPEDFTQSVLSVDRNQPHKATLELKTRQATNVISGTIIDRVTYEVTQHLGHKISEEYLENIFIQSRDTLQDVKDAADGAQTLHSGLVDLQSGSQDLNQGFRDALSGGQDLSDGLSTALSGAKSLQSGVYSAGQGASDLHSGIQDAYNGSVSLRGAIGQAFSGEQALSSGVKTADQGAASLADGLKSASAGAASLNQGLQSAASGAGNAVTAISSAAGQLTTLQQGVDGVSQLTGAVQSQSQAVAGTANDLAGWLSKFTQDHPDLAADPEIQDLQQKIAGLNQQSAALAGAAGQLGATQTAVKAGFSQGVGGISQLGAGVAQLKSGLDQLAAGSGSLAANLPKLQQGAAQLTDGLNTAVSGSDSLGAGLGKITDGANGLVNGLKKANSGSDTLAAGINDLGGGSHTLVSGLADLQDGGQKLESGLTDLKVGGQKLQDGVQNAADGSQELYQKLNDGYQQSKDNLSAAKTDQEKPVLADPVQLNEQYTDPVNTYGTGFTPYFIPLSLWVGAMAIFFLSKMMTITDSRQFPPFRLLLEVVRRYLVFGMIGVIQSVVLGVVLMKALGLSPNHIGLFFGFTILSSLLDIAIFQFLTTLFGEPAGTFIGVVLLMLQLTSSAGTYPRETIPPFFNMIAPYLPMTYVVSGLRDIISGSQANVEAVMIIFGLCIVILLLATAIFKRFFANIDVFARSRYAASRRLAGSLAGGGDLPLVPGEQEGRSSAAADRPHGWTRIFKHPIRVRVFPRSRSSRK